MLDNTTKHIIRQKVTQILTIQLAEQLEELGVLLDTIHYNHVKELPNRVRIATIVEYLLGEDGSGMILMERHKKAIDMEDKEIVISQSLMDVLTDY